MKTTRLVSMLLITLSLAAACVGQSVNWDSWSWTAPEPPLPDTVWYDYGWDSTSNGPTPAEALVAAPPQSAAQPAPEPSHRDAIARRQAQVNPPQLPPMPAPVPPAPVAPQKDTAKLTAPRTHPGRLYADTFLALRTPNFSTGDYLYGVGVGYQVTKYWAVDARVAHHGLDVTGNAIEDIGGRLIARMPFEFLSPYTFLGASFDLDRDDWHLQPGAGIELGVNKRLRGLSVFAEGGLDADLQGHNGYLFAGGIRFRY